jgi:hypothetical protein
LSEGALVLHVLDVEEDAAVVETDVVFDVPGAVVAGLGLVKGTWCADADRAIVAVVVHDVEDSVAQQALTVVVGGSGRSAYQGAHASSHRHLRCDLMDTTHLISIAQVGATAFVGVVAGFITWKMQSKQIDIAKGVKEIARAQHETAATKLRLELFEKRFEVYKEVLACIDTYILYSPKTTDEEFKSMRIRWSAACSSIKFLFDEPTHQYIGIVMGNAILDHAALVDALERHKDHVPSSAELNMKHSDNFVVLKNAIEETQKRMSPFLTL